MKRYPNESDEYREARQRLLQKETELRAKVAEVAALRQKLPYGGGLKEDYAFEEMGPGGAKQKVKLSELFAPGQSTVVLYSFMFDADWDEPCPMCTSIVDSLNGAAHQINKRAQVVIVGKAPIEKLNAFAQTRRWGRTRLLSSAGTTYNADYFGEFNDYQQPMINVFTKKPDGIRHFWGSELLFGDDLREQRHADTIWPLWNVLDLTPEGRGTDWYPSISD